MAASIAAGEKDAREGGVVYGQEGGGRRGGMVAADADAGGRRGGVVGADADAGGSRDGVVRANEDAGDRRHAAAAMPAADGRKPGAPGALYLSPTEWSMLWPDRASRGS